MKYTRIMFYLCMGLFTLYPCPSFRAQGVADGIDLRSADASALVQEQSRLAAEQVRLVEEQIQMEKQRIILEGQLNQVTQEARTERDRDRRSWLRERQDELREDLSKHDEQSRQMAETRIALAERQRQIALLQGRQARDAREQVFARAHQHLADARLRISRRQVSMPWDAQLRAGILEEQKRLTAQQRILVETHALLMPDDAPRDQPLARHHLAQAQLKLAQAQQKMDERQDAIETALREAEAERARLQEERRVLNAARNRNTEEWRAQDRANENKGRTVARTMVTQRKNIEDLMEKRPDLVRELHALAWLQGALADNMDERRNAEALLSIAEHRTRVNDEEERLSEEAREHKLPADLDQRLSGIHRRLATQILRLRELKPQFTEQQLTLAREQHEHVHAWMIRQGASLPEEKPADAPPAAEAAAP